MKEQEKELIREALLLEQEGYEFYQLAAERCEEEEVKLAFVEMAAEEKKHMDWLQELYRGLEEDESASLNLEDFHKTPDVFNNKVVEPLKSSLAVSVFGIGVKMEKAAFDYYQEAAKKTENQKAKELYEELIRWEKEHLDEFQKEYEMLQQNWWNDQHFAPF